MKKIVFFAIVGFLISIIVTTLGLSGANIDKLLPIYYISNSIYLITLIILFIKAKDNKFIRYLSLIIALIILLTLISAFFFYHIQSAFLFIVSGTHLISLLNIVMILAFTLVANKYSSNKMPFYALLILLVSKTIVFISVIYSGLFNIAFYSLFFIFLNSLIMLIFYLLVFFYSYIFEDILYN